MDTPNNTGLPENTRILLKEYDILIDLLKYLYTQRQDFNRTFLFINIILVSTYAVILQIKSPEELIFPALLCLSGIAVSIIWICITERLSVDTKLRWFQLRYIERCLLRTDGIFIKGLDFFKMKTLKSPDSKEEPLEFPGGFSGILAKFRVLWTGLLLPFLFICLYIALIFI